MRALFITLILGSVLAAPSAQSRADKSNADGGASASTGALRARPALQKKVESLLMKSDAFRDLGRPTGDVKKGGGMDGGGGDPVEAEFTYFLSASINRLLSVKDLVRGLGYLNDAELAILSDLLPRGSYSQRVCVVAAANPRSISCGERPFRVDVNPSKWRGLNDDGKRAFAHDELLKILGFTDPKARSEKAWLIGELLSPRAENFHRLDVIARRDDGTTLVTINGKTNRKLGVRFETKVAEGQDWPSLRIIIDGLDRQRDGTYSLDSSSPYFNVNVCENKHSQHGMLLAHGRELFYREAKALVEACEKKIARGQEIRTYWVSDKTKLVVNCR